MATLLVCIASLIAGVFAAGWYGERLRAGELANRLTAEQAAHAETKKFWLESEDELRRLRVDRTKTPPVTAKGIIGRRSWAEIRNLNQEQNRKEVLAAQQREENTNAM